MVLQSSGAISLDDIQTEFGGTNPIDTSEYYGVASGIPSSGTISFSQFYGKSSGTSGTTLRSRNLTGNQLYTMYTTTPTKDMEIRSTQYIPSGYNPSSGNLTPSGTSYAWRDWGGDIFDYWGYFYIYDPATNTASYISFSDIDGPDEVVYTETQTHFSKSFTIKHGWVAQGIFKLDIECDDSTFQFSIGAYGNMGSDSLTQNTDRQYSASWGTLSYNYNSQSNSSEFFYSHFIPKLKSFNDGITLSSGNFTSNFRTAIRPNDELGLWSDTLTVGATMYFVKGSDSSTGAMYDWVANDIELS